MILSRSAYPHHPFGQAALDFRELARVEKPNLSPKPEPEKQNRKYYQFRLATLIFAQLFFYAITVLPVFKSGFILHWRHGRINATKCHHHTHVYRADAECRQFTDGYLQQDA
jgi:hypothetical protein